MCLYAVLFLLLPFWLLTQNVNKQERNCTEVIIIIII